MRLETLTVQHFGALGGLELDDLAASPVVVILGPNESGKSTLRDLVTSLLFGFDPASGNRHPLASRGLDLSVHARFVDSEGGSIDVQRTLGASAARGQVVSSGGTSTLRNDALAHVGHVSRGVYASLASVDAADLRSLADTGGWKLAQERLLGGAHVEGLIPASVAAADLRGRREALWRPDRRGTKVLVPRLEIALKDARGRVRAAAAERREAGRLERERAALSAGLERLRSEGERSSRLAHVLYPIAVTAGRVEEHRRAAERLCGGREAAAGPHPAAALEGARAAAERAAERLEAARGALAETRADATAPPEATRDAALASVLERVERAVDAADRADRSAESAASDSRRVASLRNEAAAVVAVDPEDDAGLAGFARLDPQHLVQARGEAAAPVIVAGRRPTAGQLLLILAALVLVGVLALAGAPSAVVVGAAAAAALTALIIPLVGASGPARRGARTDAPPGRPAPAAIVRALAGVPVHPSRLAGPDPTLIDDVVLLVARQRELERVRLAADRAAGVARRERSVVRELLEGAGSGSVDSLRRRVEAARVTVEAARSQARRLPDRERAEQEAAVAGAAAAVDVLRVERLLAALSPSGDVQDGLDRAVHALELRATAEAEERIARERFPDLEALRAEAAHARQAGELPEDDDAAGQMARRASELADERAETAAEEARLGERLQTIVDGPGIADAAGAVRALEAEIAEARRAHDRLALTEAIVRAADVRLRRSRRPRFLIRATELIVAITGGAIEELDVADRPGGRAGANELVLRRRGVKEFEAVGHPLSLGTLQQIHLAIRLALLDEIDPLRLPLFLDEALVHWDGDRVAGFLQLLRAVDDRQVIVTTCHPWLAEAIEAECSARVIRLPGRLVAAT